MAGIHVGGIDQCLKRCKTTLQQNLNILDYKQKFIGNNHVLLLYNITKSVGSWGISEYIHLITVTKRTCLVRVYIWRHVPWQETYPAILNLQLPPTKLCVSHFASTFKQAPYNTKYKQTVLVVTAFLNSSATVDNLLL